METDPKDVKWIKFHAMYNDRITTELLVAILKLTARPFRNLELDQVRFDDDGQSSLNESEG